MRIPKDQLKIGIILNYINMGIGNIIPIIYTPIMLRILGQEEYGLYKLSSVATSYLGLISMGLGAAITRYLIKARTEEGQIAEEKMLGLFLIIFRIIAFITLAIGLLLAFNLDIWYSDSLKDQELNKMRTLVFIMVINMAFSFSVSPYISIVSAREKFVFFQCMGIVSTCIIPLINLVVLFMGYASIGLAISSLIIAIVIRFIYYLYVTNSMNLRPRYNNLPINQLKEILLFSFWIFVANVVSKLYAATDTMMIGAIPTLAVVGVAVYNVGGVLEGMIGSATVGISGMLSPRINKMVFSGLDNKKLTDYSIMIGRIQCYIVSFLMSVFIVFGEPMIHFYLGNDYLEAYWIALFIGIPKIIVLAQSVCLNILIARNMHRFRSIIYLLVAIGNVIVTWTVLPYWGILGAAFITGISFLLGHGLIMNWFYWNKVGLDIPRFWRQVSKVFFIPIILCFISYFVCHYINLYNLVALIISIIVFSLMLFGFQWYFSFNDYEKNLLKTPMMKVLGIRKP